jgi:hypothetical protein
MRDILWCCHSSNRADVPPVPGVVFTNLSGNPKDLWYTEED